MDDRDGLSSVRRAATRDRRRFWLVVVGLTAAVMAIVVVAVVVMGPDVSPGTIGGIGGAIAFALAFFFSRQPSTSSTTESRPSEGDLGNVAFSTHSPTWRGWKRDQGVLEPEPGRLVLRGLKQSLTIERPRARLFDSRWMYWQMVEVSGALENGAPVTVYLVPAGAPRVKKPSLVEPIRRSAARLVETVNAS